MLCSVLSCLLYVSQENISVYAFVFLFSDTLLAVRTTCCFLIVSVVAVLFYWFYANYDDPVC